MRTILSGLAVTTLCVLAGASLAQRPRALFLDEAPLDRAVDFPREKLAEYFAQMSKEQIVVVRLLEGGEYNVNIRRVENVTPDNYRTEFHEDTIDVWVIEEGSGTLVTGGEQVDGKHQGGIERPIGVGDVIFIPAGIHHGMKETEAMTWLNIRFPEHRN
jgi:mannose-6-phosphate isomerase-like protein (cupin superfamily)